MKHTKTTYVQKPDTPRIITLIAAATFYLASGVLLLFAPQLMLRAACFALAAILIIRGVCDVIGYVRADVDKALSGFGFARGIAALCAATAIIVFPDLLVNAAPIIWGASLLYGALLEMQMSVDLFRLKDKKWWISLIFMAVSIALGVMVLIDPPLFSENYGRFVGVALAAAAFMLVGASIKVGVYLKARKKAVAQSETQSEPEVYTSELKLDNGTEEN